MLFGCLCNVVVVVMVGGRYKEASVLPDNADASSLFHYVSLCSSGKDDSHCRFEVVEVSLSSFWIYS